MKTPQKTMIAAMSKNNAPYDCDAELNAVATERDELKAKLAKSERKLSECWKDKVEAQNRVHFLEQNPSTLVQNERDRVAVLSKQLDTSQAYLDRERGRAEAAEAEVLRLSRSVSCEETLTAADTPLCNQCAEAAGNIRSTVAVVPATIAREMERKRNAAEAREAKLREALEVIIELGADHKHAAAVAHDALTAPSGITDTQRLDWLDRHRAGHGANAFSVMLEHGALRAAIDAAMRQEGNHHE